MSALVKLSNKSLGHAAPVLSDVRFRKNTRILSYLSSKLELAFF